MDAGRHTRSRRFLEARSGRIAQSLLREADLLALRSIAEQGQSGSRFCDGCGFCCVSTVRVARLEYDRIRELVEEHPELPTLQGMVCPFLALEPDRFDRSLSIYGRTRAPMEAMPCRIYEERPLSCRMYPGPSARRCREHQSLEAPDLLTLLLAGESGGYPELLIQRYYLTLQWESYEEPEDPLDPGLLFQLVPGWQIDKAGGALRLRSGPHWERLYTPFPEVIPVPDSCELGPEAIEVMEALARPVSYRALLLERFGELDAGMLGELLAVAELARIVVPVDFALRARRHPRSYLDWAAGR